jgi:hypothetical protein
MSGNYLQSASRVHDNSTVWAVGYYYESGHPRTLIERWDGANWQVVPSPNVGTISNSLFGVSGDGANDVWAVGAYNLDNQTGTLQTLTEHWDGNAWNVVPSPNQGSADNILYAATRTQFADWAVGTYSDGINGRTLVLLYDDPCVTPTPTPTETCVVTGASCFASFPPPTDFTVTVSCPVDPFSCGSMTVNGVFPDSCRVSDLITVIFHFNTSPVVPGINTLHVPAGGIYCCVRPVDEFACTFPYSPPSPSPTPSPSPRPTPGSRPRPTPHPRP